MALVFPLNSSSRSQAAQESAPHRKTPAEFTSDYLHNIPQTQLQMRTIYNPQQHQQQQQTQLLQNQSSNVSRFVGAAPKLPKRGVNSFMAFRAFYSQIFTAFQQKNSSTLIKLLWDEDPFRAKWSILARAYTTIRDHVGKEKVPIVGFLEIVCPQIGIIGVNEYLIKMNWVIETAEDGSIFLRQHSSPDFDAFSSHIMNTPMTEKDVTYYCAFRGYITPQTSFQVAGPIAQGRNNTTTTPQQGLLASAPVISPNIPASVENYVGHGRENLAMASDIPGFNFGPSVGTTTLHEDYEWGSNSFDLYAGEGLFDFEPHFTPPNNIVWDNFNTVNSPEVNRFLDGGGLQEGGYFNPPSDGQESDTYC